MPKRWMIVENDVRRALMKRFPYGALAFLLGLTVSALPSFAADEAGLLAIWKQHAASPEDHAGTVAACESFEKARPGDVFVPVVQEIRAWHLLKTGQTPAAKRILDFYLDAPDDPIRKGGQMVAQGWLTRLDREEIAKALRLYYRKEVGFPAELAAVSRHPKIPAEARPVLQDRFGDPWQYRLVGIAGLDKFQDQRYELRSVRLGDQSDLETVLQAPYAHDIRKEPVQVWTDLKPPQVTFRDAGGGGTAAALPVGEQVGDFYLAYAGSSVIVVCNHSYWKVFLKP